MKTAVIMVCESDLPALDKTVQTLKSFGVEADVRVLNTHRTDDEAHAFAASAADSGIEVIIAAADHAVQLAGVLAAHTTMPVIALPIKPPSPGGLESLLSIVRMPLKTSAATVAINGAENAALLAVQILAVKYGVLKAKLTQHKKDLVAKVDVMNQKLQKEFPI